MQIFLQIPDDLAAAAIPAGQDATRAALEALAIEGYRANRLNESQVRRMMGYSTRMQVHALLMAHDVYLHYTDEHLALDIAASDQLHAERTSALALAK